MHALTLDDIHTLQRGMTVADLIEELEQFDPEAKVVFACDYGDIIHTQQALPVTTADELDPDTERIARSAYSQSGIAVEDLRREEDGTPLDDSYDGPPVVVLR